MPEISRDQEPERIVVSIADQITKCYIIPTIKQGVAYISSDLAESIKRCYAPTDKHNPNVWYPHQPKHVHLMDASPGAQPARGGHRNWNTNLSKLAASTKIHDAEKGKRDYARAKAKREEAARCAAETTTPTTDIPESDIDEPSTTTYETLSLDAPSPS